MTWAARLRAWAASSVRPGLARLRPCRGLFLAVVVATAALLVQPGPRPLDLLPLDAWIYSAMADEPSVFTARPWGYRLLGPWLVHGLFGTHQGFAHLTRAALLLASMSVFAFLRRLGHGEIASLAAVAAFALSAPAGLALRQAYLCEPLSVLLEVSFLLGVASGAGLGVLALLAVLAALSKEILLVLLPLVYLARRQEEGRLRALRAAALVALPALAVTALLRLWWTPQFRTPPFHLPDLGLLPLALERLVDSWGKTGLLLGGLTPLAAIGAFTPAARSFRRRYGYLPAAFLILPFVAWIYDPRPGRVPFFGATVERLLIYAVPLLLPLALLAVDRVVRLPAVSLRPSRPPRPLVNRAAALLALVLAAMPLWGLDRYRRIEILAPLHGPVVRALCRESLRMAARVARGDEVSFDPAWSVTSETNPRLSRIRWFLRDGWGDFPCYGEGEIVMTGARASILLPCSRPQRLELRLSLSATRETVVGVEVNGLPLSPIRVLTEPGEQRLRVPRSALFRGDNLLSLVATAGSTPQLRLRGVRIRRDVSTALR